MKVARAHAHRVVVKRPPYADPLAGDVTHTISANLVRYDVYIKT